MLSNKKCHFFFIKNKLFYFNPSAKNKLLPVNGKFSVDKNNNLAYLVVESKAWHRQHKIPERIEFKGNWRLNSNHDLVLNIQDTGRKPGKEKLVLKGKILDCQKNYLLFQIKTKTSGTKESISFLKLKGFWQSDKFNRLTFEITKKENPDTLAFKGLWSVNKKQKITYLYQKANLTTKKKISQKLTFDGFWQISEKNRLKYLLAGSKSSLFDFKAYLQSNNLYPKKGVIKYRIGIGAKEQKQERIISLYGEWKFSRKLGLTFEMNYGGGQINRIQFASTVNLNKENKIIFTLKDKNNKPLGITITFKRDLFPRKDLEYFLQLKKQGKTLYIGLGATASF